MFLHKRTIALAVLLFLGIAALGTMQPVETQEAHQPDPRKNAILNHRARFSCTRENKGLSLAWQQTYRCCVIAHGDLGAARPKPADKDNVPAFQGTRRDFARAMSRIKEGMPEKDIRALLGMPDDVRTHNDAGGIATLRTREVWRYGTDGHLTFPTLGCVYIDNAGKSQYVIGARGEPPDPKVLPEAELRKLLRMIDKAPTYQDGYHYDPLAVIRIVNVLQPLGKDKALAVIDEYLRVASHWESSAREGLFLVLRVLFDVPTDPGHMPDMVVGAPWPDMPIDAKRLPRYPILLQDDVPFLLVSGYYLGGRAEQPESHVTYFRENGRLRDKPLAPGDAPLDLLDSVIKKAGWPPGGAMEGKMLIANQLLNMVDSVYRRDTDAHGYRFMPRGDVEGQWKSIAAEAAKLDMRWNAAKNCFTFKDGSHLAEPTPIK